MTQDTLNTASLEFHDVGEDIHDDAAPSGPIERRWDERKFSAKLVNPANRRKMSVIIVGTGLAGGAAAATLGEAGYHVKSFCYQDSPRRAHSIAAQGGINAAKNYRNDGDSIYRLFYDTVKGGDFRSRESNSYRLAQVSVNIIDQCVAQGVPFAREYGGLLDNRSFGGVQVSRTFYARGQTGQQLLIGAYQALERQIAAGTVEMHSRHEMLDLIMVPDADGTERARGIIARDLVTGEIETHTADAVVLCSGGYGNVYFLSTNAMGSNVTATWRAHRRGAYMGNPCYTQIHPTCIPVSGDYQSKLTLMSESLRNDGRIWVPKKAGDDRHPRDIPEDERDYYLERIYPAFGNLVPRDIASRAAKYQCDDGKGVGPGGLGVYLDFADAIERMGRKTVEAKYGNLFDMYARITGEDPYTEPMRIYPAVHYVMGGLWVDYDLQSNLTGLFVGGEANFSDQGANRLGASALMQGLADGYFVLPSTLPDYLSAGAVRARPDDHPRSSRPVRRSRSGSRSCCRSTGPARSTPSTASSATSCGSTAAWSAPRGPDQGHRHDPGPQERVLDQRQGHGRGPDLNQALERAGRRGRLLELGELMCIDALHRAESCGGHFRAESQTEDGEALRHDDQFAYVAAWSSGDEKPVLHKEPLEYEYVEMKARSYK
ncbi:MAG: fumarate reductase/succinate dehydrogenase flavoprotein subunit [Aeromicrobium erythreum]